MADAGAVQVPVGRAELAALLCASFAAAAAAAVAAVVCWAAQAWAVAGASC